MSQKQQLMEALQLLPEDATLDELLEELTILTAIRRGEADADAGRLIPHDEVIRRFTSGIQSRVDRPGTE
jgi:predicted transcriptional regulator